MAKLKNKRWDRFCEFYTSKDMFGNGSSAYCEAFNKNPKSPADWNAVRAASSRLLTNVNVCNRINEILDKQGFNDQNVDNQHLFLINQHADFKTKMSAIKEYNNLKKRTGQTVQLQQNNLSYERHIHIHGGQRQVGTSLPTNEEQLRAIPIDVSEDNDESVRNNKVSAKHSTGDIRGEVERTSKGGQAYPGLCA